MPLGGEAQKGRGWYPSEEFGTEENVLVVRRMLGAHYTGKGLVVRRRLGAQRKGLVIKRRVALGA